MWMQAFTMKDAYFKTDTSRPVQFLCTSDGRIDISGLGVKFGLDPTSIELNGVVVPMTVVTPVESRSNWEQIKEYFTEKGKAVGTQEDPVVVSGTAAVHVDTGMFPARTGYVSLKSRVCLCLRC